MLWLGDNPRTFADAAWVAYYRPTSLVQAEANGVCADTQRNSDAEMLLGFLVCPPSN